MKQRFVRILPGIHGVVRGLAGLRARGRLQCLVVPVRAPVDVRKQAQPCTNLVGRHHRNGGIGKGHRDDGPPMAIAACIALPGEIDDEFPAIWQRQQRRGVIMEYGADNGNTLLACLRPALIALAAEASGGGRHSASGQIDEAPLLQVSNRGQPRGNEGAVIFLGAFGVAEMRRRIAAQRLPRQHRRQRKVAGRALAFGPSFDDLGVVDVAWLAGARVVTPFQRHGGGIGHGTRRCGRGVDLPDARTLRHCHLCAAGNSSVPQLWELAVLFAAGVRSEVSNAVLTKDATGPGSAALHPGRLRPRSYGRPRCRAAHRATLPCGPDVSPPSGFHRPLAPLG